MCSYRHEMYKIGVSLMKSDVSITPWSKMFSRTSGRDLTWNGSGRSSDTQQESKADSFHIRFQQRVLGWVSTSLKHLVLSDRRTSAFEVPMKPYYRNWSTTKAIQDILKVMISNLSTRRSNAQPKPRRSSHSASDLRRDMIWFKSFSNTLSNSNGLVISFCSLKGEYSPGMYD